MTVPPREALGLMEAYHSPQVDVSVRLNTNESPFPPPSGWEQELARAVTETPWNRYPDRSASQLREAIATFHGTVPERVFAANGSNEVLQCLLLAYGGPGRKVAVWEPTYALHGHIARITGAEVVEGERDDAFRIDLDEVVRVLDDARPSVAFLCSPNNPTGVVDGEETVRAVLEAVAGRDCLLVVDEAYGQFSPWSSLDLISDETPLVVTRTFSKTWSMAAARLGYLVGPSWLTEQLSKVVLPYHLDALKQRAGVLALNHVGEMERRVAGLVSERERLVAGLAELPVEVWPSGANFVLFRPEVGDGQDAADVGRRVWEGLLERSVLVRDCSSWPRLEGCLRVTIGTEVEDDAFLTALEEVLC